MEFSAKTIVYNFLSRFPENKGNETPDSSKKVPPAGVDPPFPRRPRAGDPLDHGSCDMKENAAYHIVTPLISTSGCSLSSNSRPIHDVYNTRYHYTLRASATPAQYAADTCSNKEGLRKNCGPSGGAPLPPHIRQGRLSPGPAQLVSPTQNHNRYDTISYDLHADNSLKLCTKTNTLCVNIYLHAVLICSEKYPYYNDQVPIPTRQSTSAHQTTVKDGEESSNGDDTSQNQSNSKASNGTQRNVSSRKPLWNHRTGIKPRDGNDGDDDDPNPSTKPPKIKSRCERNDDPLDSCNGKSTSPSDNDGADNDDTDYSLNTTNQLDQSKANYSMMSDTSLFRMIGFAKSWLSGANANHSGDTQTATETEFIVDSPLSSSTQVPPPKNPCPSTSGEPTTPGVMTPVIIVPPPQIEEL